MRQPQFWLVENLMLLATNLAIILFDNIAYSACRYLAVLKLGREGLCCNSISF